MAPNRPSLDDLRTLPEEPLLPIEKQLILWSVGLGVVLLGVLVWLSRTLFPA